MQLTFLDSTWLGIKALVSGCLVSLCSKKERRALQEGRLLPCHLSGEHRRAASPSPWPVTCVLNPLAAAVLLSCLPSPAAAPPCHSNAL